MTEALTKLQLGRYIRRHIGRELYDDSGAVDAHGIAIYSLVDPANLRDIRYVGQTSAPQRRFLQHLNAARLWLPDERPWWIKSPDLRPLYGWIRALYRADFRLPTMVVSGWVEGVAAARLAERSRICECLAQNLPLLNVEAQRNPAQIRLL